MWALLQLHYTDIARRTLRLLLAVLVLIRGFQLLFMLRAVESFGRSLLPVMYTFKVPLSLSPTLQAQIP